MPSKVIRDAEQQISKPQKQFWPQGNQQPSPHYQKPLPWAQPGSQRTAFWLSSGLLCKGSPGALSMAVPVPGHQKFISPIMLLYHSTAEIVLGSSAASWMLYLLYATVISDAARRHHIDHRRHQVDYLSHQCR
ncbi:hypothetical protein ABBQ38_004677 [Trebouxia sp. C0009 RCD-2024]